AQAFTSYELSKLGKFAHENVVANPFAQDTTIVAGTDDTTPFGKVYLYVGTKMSGAFNSVQLAGLTNGTNYAIQVGTLVSESRDFGLATSGPGLTTSGRFTLVDPAGATNNGTGFSRPEDAAWDPIHPADLYFVTTDRLDTLADGVGT